MNGYNTKFYRSEDNVTFTQVPGLMEIEPPEISRDTYETTLMDNSDNANGYKAYEGAMRDAGELSVTLAYQPENAAQNALVEDVDADDARYYRIEYPDGTTVSFRAIATSLGSTLTRDDRVTRNFKFKVSGPVTVA